ncbi:ADP/ATP carrier protein [Rhizophlyctis rosea]|uniref:ADP/ATP carrier protein n=1 Tax=Rhizophlyctis rosea TaxID=64517 RepID=A0AAD5S6Y1_9FUNG|nr:ADP/ATP carrier protein [Rhizophlyctis rosea]
MADRKLPPLADATSGALGAVVANTLVFPLDVIKTRLQVQSKTLSTLSPHQSYTSSSDAFLKIVRTEGIAGLYSGLGAGLLGTVANAFAYFWFYAQVRGWYSRRIGGEGGIGTGMELGLGAVAGALSQFFTLPISVVTTRQQTTVKHEQLSFLQTMKQIRYDEGIQGLWKGLRASLVLCVNPAITYGMFERLKTVWLKRSNNPDGRLSAGQVFILGALSKTLATVVTYPYIMAKVRLQWAPPKITDGELSDDEKESITYKSAPDVLRKVFASEGLAGLYQGMEAQIVKAVLCQAILFVCKDEISVYTMILLRFLFRNNNKSAVSRVPG